MILRKYRKRLRTLLRRDRRFASIVPLFFIAGSAASAVALAKLRLFLRLSPHSLGTLLPPVHGFDGDADGFALWSESFDDPNDPYSA